MLRYVAIRKFASGLSYSEDAIRGKIKTGV